MRGIVALTVCAALIAGCSNGNKPTPRQLKQIDRVLERAPGKAQPSIIVKTELALSRGMRESDSKKALTFFAAPGAKFHTKEGLADTRAFVTNSSSRGEGPKLETKTVLMSCDGSLAVSQGRLTENNKVGNYVIVWERQSNIRSDGDEETGYRYVYFTAEPDDPQPPPRKEPEGDPGGIIVEAIDSVRADIATCAPRGDIYLEALAEMAQGFSSGSNHSTDRTLQWKWLASDRGTRRIEVSLWRKGARETVFTLDLPSGPK